MYFAPPLISYGTDEPIACRPLGASLLSGGVALGGIPSYAPSSHGVNDYMDSRAIDHSLEDWLNAELGVTDACNHARSNQQTTLLLVIAGGVTALIGLALRQLTLIRLAQHRHTALLQRLGQRDAPAEAGMD
ncbi:hypothetical protein ACWGOE_08055 [Leucobacter chromiiresistens]